MSRVDQRGDSGSVVVKSGWWRGARARSLFAIGLFVGACSGGTPRADSGGVDAADTVAAADVSIDVTVEISVDPGIAEVLVGRTVLFVARAPGPDGNPRILVDGVQWSTSDPAIATVDGAGMARGVAVGMAMIRATAGGFAAEAGVRVRAPAIVSIALSPVTANLHNCDRVGVQLVATATVDDGSVRSIGEMAVWTASAPAVVAVSNVPGSRGNVTSSASECGTANINATMNGITSSPAIVTVLCDTTIRSIAIDPATAIARVGDVVPLSAVATFHDNRTAEVTEMSTWTSDDPTIASVDVMMGTVRAVAPGIAHITASIGSGSLCLPIPLMGAATIDVRAGP